jgi:hypothetical protein
MLCFIGIKEIPVMYFELSEVNPFPNSILSERYRVDLFYGEELNTKKLLK